MKRMIKSLGIVLIGLLISTHVSAQDTTGGISGEEVNETSCLFISENTVSCTNATLKDEDNDGYLDESEFRNSDIFEIPGLESTDGSDSEGQDTLSLGNEDLFQNEIRNESIPSIDQFKEEGFNNEDKNGKINDEPSSKAQNEGM